MPQPLGIDLGTTYSAVATLDESGRSVMVPNSEGQLLTPSVVYFADNEILVGNRAKQLALTEGDRAAICAKRDMGKKHYQRKIRGAQLPPEVIQACVLKRLKDDAVRIHGEDLRAVITVPAYFDEPRRRATAQAGEMAGLRVLDIVNEPTAAALAYGEQLGYLDPLTCQALRPLKVLVYDLGGGTFDVTLLDLRPAEVRTVATDGDVALGGRDWDEALANYAADRFVEAFQIDPRRDPQSLTNLYLMAEQVKQALSSYSQAVYEIHHGGRVLPVMITRELLEELTETLLERTAGTVRQLLNAAGLTWDQIDRVLLVGGSTRMPMVARMLRDLSGKEPERDIHPDEAVARGAALYARYAMNKQTADRDRGSYQVTNVNAHSLGIEGIDRRTQRKENVILIQRNTALPHKKVKKFVTKAENQRTIVVQVLEGESRDPSHCSLIGRAVIRDLPEKLPAGWPVEVTYEYHENGRLGVQARVPGTNQAITIELQNATGLSDEKVRRWKKTVEAAKGFDSFEELLDDVLFDAGISDSPAANSSSAKNSVRQQSTTVALIPKFVTSATTAATSDLASTHKPTAIHSTDAASKNTPIPKQTAVPRQAPSPPLANSPIRTDPAAESSTAISDDWFSEHQARERQKSVRKLLVAGGFVLSAFLGLLIGYYIVANIIPGGNFLHLRLPGLPE